MADMVKMDDWLGAVPSKQTRKTYRNGIKKFELFYGKPIETLLDLSDAETGHIIEKFYAWLTDKGHPQNTKRNVVNCAVQYLKYFGKNPKYRKALGIYRTVESTRDKKLLISDVQEMGKVADLREQVLLEVFLLGLRISDASVLEWKYFLEDEFTLTTRKEQITAHIFISPEFRELLNKYLNTLDKSNKYLFQSKKNVHLTVKHLDHILKSLAKRAGLQDWQRIHWHLARKLVLRTSAELGLSLWSAKMLVGKAIPMSDSTYLQGTALKEDFMKLSKVLTLKQSNGNGKVTRLEEVVNSLEKENAISKTRIDLMQKNQTEQSKEINALRSVLLTFVDRDGLELLVRQKMQALPDFSMAEEAGRLVYRSNDQIKAMSKAELMQYYNILDGFVSPTKEEKLQIEREDAPKKSTKEALEEMRNEKQERARLAHEESLRIREKIQQAKEKAQNPSE